METTPSEVAGRNIRAEMARRGISQTDLAHRLNLSQAAVSKRLRGVTPLDVNELYSIGTLLDVPVSVLMAGAEVVPA